jgi:hypothetical protein
MSLCIDSAFRQQRKSPIEGYGTSAQLPTNQELDFLRWCEGGGEKDILQAI